MSKSEVNATKMNQLLGKGRMAVPTRDDQWPLPEAYIGVEIEVEQCSIVNPIGLKAAGWKWKTDGSLRNQGMEFIFASPCSGGQITEAVDMFFSTTPHRPVEYVTNPRAGVHIHINFLDDADLGDVRKLIALMYAFEPGVFEWVDQNRKWCGYCSPINELPESTLRTLMTSNSASAVASVIQDQQSRYYGLNLAALSKFGTIEFRYFPATQSKAQLTSWIKFVMLAKKAAVEFDGDALGLIKELSTEDGIRSFAETWFNVDDIGCFLLAGTDLSSTPLRMIEFGYMLNVVPARVSTKNKPSLATKRFFEKKFPDYRDIREEADSYAARYVAAMETLTSMEEEAYSRMVADLVGTSPSPTA